MGGAAAGRRVEDVPAGPASVPVCDASGRIAGNLLKILIIQINHKYDNSQQYQYMTTKKENGAEYCPCTPPSACRVEAVLSVDERGQTVLPKDVRERAGIRPGDKLALIALERDGTVCCLALMKADRLSGMVKEILGPLMSGID